MPVPLAGLLFIVSLVATLLAASAFARRLDRLGAHFGLPEALIGLLTALAADGPEISSSLVALIKGDHGVSTGVLVGSNVFNLAAMIALSALLVGCIRLPGKVLVPEGVVQVLVIIITGTLLLGWLPVLVAVIMLAAVLGPYLIVLIREPRTAGESRVGPGTQERLDDPSRHLLAIVALDVPLIVAGSLGMVQAALSLGTRWHIPGALLGVLILGPLTSIPNAVTAVRLGLGGRGSALVSEAFNSNTINLVAGIAVPALLVTIAARTALAQVDVAWLLAITAVCLTLLSRPRGMRRPGAALVIALYAGFVITQLRA